MAPVERRVDPDDGTAYTWEEFSEYYRGKYKKKAIEAYWEDCKVAKAKKGKKSSEEKPEPKAKAKAKAKAKVKAKAKAEPKKYSADVLADKESFAKFVIKATKSTKTPEYRQLYRMLLQVFIDADHDFDGRVEFGEFDPMVDIAARLPRRFGYAPTAAEAYKTDDDRKAARLALFKTMDADGSGSITFDEWFAWAYKHIGEKAATINVDDAKKCMTFSKDHFKTWVIAACSSTGTQEYKELFAFLVDCFSAGDRDKKGRVTADQFSRMVDIAARAPRKFGYAPAAKDMFKDKDEQSAARKKMFEDMDEDKSGTITLDEWVSFCYKHICEKAKTLDDSLSGSVNKAERGSRA